MYQLFNVSRVDAYRSLWRCTFPVLQSLAHIAGCSDEFIRNSSKWHLCCYLAKLCVYLDFDQIPDLTEKDYQLW